MFFFFNKLIDLVFSNIKVSLLYKKFLFPLFSFGKKNIVFKFNVWFLIFSLILETFLIFFQKRLFI